MYLKCSDSSLLVFVDGILVTLITYLMTVRNRIAHRLLVCFLRTSNWPALSSLKAGVHLRVVEVLSQVRHPCKTQDVVYFHPWPWIVATFDICAEGPGSPVIREGSIYQHRVR